MKIGNVITVSAGRFDSIKSFPINTPKDIDKTHSYYIDQCRIAGADEDSYSDDYLIQEGSYSDGNDFEITLVFS